MLLFYMPFQGGASRWHECCMYLGETDFHYNVKGSFTMRKTIALGLLALSLSFFAGVVLAGNAEICDSLQKKNIVEPDVYIPGLYGLCTAYWSTDDEGDKAQILSNFERKAGEDGPTMPGLLTCPCWDHEALVDASCNHELTGPGLFGFDNGHIQFFNFPTQCAYANYYTGKVLGSSIDPEQFLTCAAGLTMLANGELLEYCD